MVPRTATALGRLDTRETGGLFRVRGLVLRADADYPYWLTPGVTYGLVHDGVSWTVSGGPWVAPGRVYRLWGSGVPACSVPTSHGVARLVPGLAYLARWGPGPGWRLWRLAR
ncbi:hypothetical protein [Longispora fulva]|uniref:Uncharacterized protein n=1 Tax=Longispora fulva TaxID=619741 RepID=A0A8J7GNE1_9ACTN|nr:hypothetical protein [Longispora fulva]MBG6141656.1 hypothetical protein [Longispora fulva]